MGTKGGYIFLQPTDFMTHEELVLRIRDCGSNILDNWDIVQAMDKEYYDDGLSVGAPDGSKSGGSRY